MHLSPSDIVITPSSHPTLHSPLLPSTLDHLTNTDHELEGLSASARAVEDLSAGELGMIPRETTSYRSGVVHGEHISNLGEILSVSLLNHFLLKTLEMRTEPSPVPLYLFAFVASIPLPWLFSILQTNRRN